MCHPNEWDTSLGTPGLVAQSTVSINYPELIVNGIHQLSWQLSMSWYQSSFTQLSPDHSCNIITHRAFYGGKFINETDCCLPLTVYRKRKGNWTLYTLTPHILSLTKIILLESWKQLLSYTCQRFLREREIFILGQGRIQDFF